MIAARGAGVRADTTVRREGRYGRAPGDGGAGTTRALAAGGDPRGKP